MQQAFQRAVRLVLSPDEEWRAIAREAPAPRAIFGSFVLPLACIPATAWSLSLSIFGGEGGRDGDRVAAGLVQIAFGGLTVWGYSVLSVLALASSIYLLAPLFVIARDWAGALRIAALSSSPVFLGGVILAIPDVAYVILPAVFHGFYLLYVGLQRVIGVKEERAPEFVALSIIMFMLASTVLGAVGGALGVL